MKSRISKRLVAMVLSLIMAITMLPMQTYAYIGAIRKVASTTDGLRYGTFTNEKDHRKYVYIENDDLHFDFCIGAVPHSGGRGHTIPTALIGDMAKDNLDQYGYQDFNHEITTPLDKIKDIVYGGKRPTHPRSMLEDGRAKWRNLTNLEVKEFGRTKDKKNRPKGLEDGMYVTLLATEDRGLYTDRFWQSDYFMSNKYVTIRAKYDVTMYFQLVQVDKGETNADKFPEFVAKESAEPGTDQNWAVRTITQFGYENGKIPQEVLMHNECYEFYRMNVTYQDFPKTGHVNVKKEVPSVFAQKIDNNGRKLSNKNISFGLDKTATNTVTEVSCNDYSFGAPFVAASDQYIYMHDFGPGLNWKKGVEGHETHVSDMGYPCQVSYKDYNLVTTGHEIPFGEGCPEINNPEVPGYCCQDLWGFRHISSTEDAKPKNPDVITPEVVELTEEADYLYVLKDGNRIRVANAENRGKYDKILASYYGNYRKVGETYEFYGGVVKLSPTISMKWDAQGDKDKTPGLTVNADGKLSFDATKITLDTPTFVFYEPSKDAKKDSVTFAGYDEKGAVKNEDGSVKNEIVYEGLALNIDSAKNVAVFNIELPGNGVNVNKAHISKFGDIIFAGELQLNLLGMAGIDMQKLKYGGNGDNFEVKGIKAEGFFEPEKALTILGFDAGSAAIKGEVDTIDDQKYAFEFELEVEDLFKTAAELELVRLKSGELCPNNLSAKFQVTKEGVGIDITPTTPVVTINGAGLGAKNIAKTIEQAGGNSHGIPPILLEVTAAGKFCKAIEGELTVQIGPSKFRVQGDNIGFSKIKFIESMGVEFDVNDAEFNHNGTNYKGYTVAAAGDLKIGILPNGVSKQLGSKFLEEIVSWFEGLGELGVMGSFGGTYATALQKDGSTKIYTNDYIRGRAGATLKDKFGLGLQVGAEVGARIGVESEVVGDGRKDLFTDWLNNQTPTGGIAASAWCGASYAEVQYTINGDTKINGGVDGNPQYVNGILNGRKHSKAQNPLSYKAGMKKRGKSKTVKIDKQTKMKATLSTNLTPLAVKTKKITLHPACVTRAIKDEDNPVELWREAVAVDKENLADGQSVILAMIPLDESKKETVITKGELDSMVASAYATGLTGWTKVSPDTEGMKDSDGIVSVENSKLLTVWGGCYAGAEELVITDKENPGKAVYFSIKKENIPDNGIFYVQANRDFKVKANATQPVTELKGMLTGNQLTPQICNPKEDMDYTICTYYEKVSENGELVESYLIDSQHVEPGETPKAVELVDEGLHAPSGEYQVSMQLYGGHGGSVSEDGTETPSTLTLPLSTATKFGDAKEQKTISYKNSNDVKKPEALKKAFLEADGNGILNAYWTPAEVEVGEEDVDGYIITLYQKDDNGKYVDTGRGYTIPQERLTRVHEAVIMGQAVTDDSLGWEQRSDPDNPNQRITLYKLKMALAADGEMGKELSFGKDYKIGVCAYKRGNNLDDEVSELTTTCRQITSEETVSNAETLRKPDPFVFDIAADSGKVELGEDGRYRYRANLSKGRNLIIKNVRSVEGDDYDDSEDYLDAYYVSVDTKTGRVSEELLESGVIYPEDETSGEETKKLCKYWYKLPDENGSLQIKIVAKHLARTEGERRYYDETVQYVFVENDNVAPTLGITENEFIADDETGLYVVSGVADPDAFIYVNNEKKGQAKADGTFSVSSTLNRVGSAYVSICAKDQYDNESEDVIIKVSRITMPGGGGNISGGGGGGYSGGGSDKPEDTKPEDTKPEDTTDIDDQNTPLDETPDSDSKTIEKKLNNGVKLVFAIKKNTLELLSVSKNATKLTIPASVTAKTGKKYKVTAISSKALQKLKKLTNVTFPKGIKKLPKKMLKGDSKLKYITFKGKLVTVPKGTFNGIYKKAIITIQNVTKKEYNSTKKLIVKSGVGKYVTIRRK